MEKVFHFAGKGVSASWKWTSGADMLEVHKQAKAALFCGPRVASKLRQEHRHNQPDTQELCSRACF